MFVCTQIQMYKIRSGYIKEKSQNNYSKEKKQQGTSEIHKSGNKILDRWSRKVGKHTEKKSNSSQFQECFSLEGRRS